LKRTLVVVLAGAALCGCGGREPEQVETQAAVPVETAVARTGAITAWVHATGLVEGAPGADWTVTAPQQARIAAVRAAAGDPVRRGEELVSFDSPQLRTDLAARSGELAQAKARLDNAQRSHDRLAKLLERGIASRREVEDARRELVDAQAALETATEARSGAAELAGRARAVAPFDGIVAQRWHNAGDLVDANEHVLRLVDPRRLEVAAAVPAADAARIVVGRPARVSVAGSTAEPVAARVVSRPALVDAGTGTATVRLRLDGAPAVGSPVEVAIAAEEEQDALIVPAAAVVAENGESAVFVVDETKHARRRAVVVGLRGVSDVQLRSGVKAGELVVVKGAQELPDGALVAAGR
jgi:cobalt-zinc-cadmium efflux system membrane fusion protein